MDRRREANRLPVSFWILDALDEEIERPLLDPYLGPLAKLKIPRTVRARHGERPVPKRDLANPRLDGLLAHMGHPGAKEPVAALVAHRVRDHGEDVDAGEIDHGGAHLPW